MSKIFAETAPLYWAKGLSVIPLKRGDKRPILNDWQQWHDKLPDADDQDLWCKLYDNNNIGLVLGKQSGVVIIDIDTTDESLQEAIIHLLPHSPWVRRGAKGCAIAYRFNGVGTFRIKNDAGETIVEHLSSRAQLVLPPSIHPKTQQPYTATSELYEVVHLLPILPLDIEIKLRKMLREDRKIDLSVSGYTKITDYVSAGSRDTSMTSVAGMFSMGVIRGELTLLEAIERLKAWVDANTQNVVGDPVDVDKGISNLLRFLRRDILDKGKVLPPAWDLGLTEEDKQRFGLNFQAHNIDCTFTELKDHLVNVFGSYRVDSVEFNTAIDEALNKLAHTKTMTEIEKERILRYISESSGTAKITIAALRKQLASKVEGGIQGLSHAEIARAVLTDLEELTQYGLDDESRIIHKWEGSHWAPVRDEELRKYVAERYGHLPLARRHSDYSAIVSTIGLLLQDKPIKVENVRGVNFANCVYTAEGNVLEHDPRYGFTYTLPFSYRPDISTKKEMFDAFLFSCWGHDPDFQDKVNLLQEMIYVTMTGTAHLYQKAFLLYGAARTGKTAMMDIISGLVPDGSRATCPPETWHDKFAPVTMHHKLLNRCNELSDDKKVDGQKFKSIVDGSEVTMQLKGGQLFVAPVRCAHWFTSNHLPKTNDTSAGFTRRWCIIEFNRVVKQSEVRLDLGLEILAQEREAIAAWAMEASERIREQNGFSEPASHKKLVSDLAKMNNIVLYFLRESHRVRMTEVPSTVRGSELGAYPSVAEQDLFKAYVGFCSGMGVRPFSRREFAHKLGTMCAEHGFRVVSRDGVMGIPERTYVGVEVLPVL